MRGSLYSIFFKAEEVDKTIKYCVDMLKEDVSNNVIGIFDPFKILKENTDKKITFEDMIYDVIFTPYYDRIIVDYYNIAKNKYLFFNVSENYIYINDKFLKSVLKFRLKLKLKLYTKI